MKRIEAIIRASQLETVKQAVLQCGVSGMTIYEAQRVGAEQGASISYRGSHVTSEYVARAKLDVIVEEDEAEAVIGAIYLNAYSGAVGDGRILVSTLDEVIRIRTGEFQPPRVDVAIR